MEDKQILMKLQELEEEERKERLSKMTEHERRVEMLTPMQKELFEDAKSFWKSPAGKKAIKEAKNAK